jgi:hypothetical protein
VNTKPTLYYFSFNPFLLCDPISSVPTHNNVKRARRRRAFILLCVIYITCWRLPCTYKRRRAALYGFLWLCSVHVLSVEQHTYTHTHSNHWCNEHGFFIFHFIIFLYTLLAENDRKTIRTWNVFQIIVADDGERGARVSRSGGGKINDFLDEQKDGASSEIWNVWK